MGVTAWASDTQAVCGSAAVISWTSFSGTQVSVIWTW